MQQLISEFADLSAGRAPVPMKLQYKDYAVHQKGGLVKRALKKQENYWLDRFSDTISETIPSSIYLMISQGRLSRISRAAIIICFPGTFDDFAGAIGQGRGKHVIHGSIKFVFFKC